MGKLTDFAPYLIVSVSKLAIFIRVLKLIHKSIFMRITLCIPRNNVLYSVQSFHFCNGYGFRIFPQYVMDLSWCLVLFLFYWVWFTRLLLCC